MREIPLTQGKLAKVDDSDFEWLSQFRWHFTGGYARRGIYRTPDYTEMRYMHDEILGIKGVDHRDTDGLNNQRHNLRPATQRQNTANRAKGKNNTSGFKGVCWDRRAGRWFAFIRPNRRYIHLGYFDTTEQAAAAYNAAAVQHFGEFANLNPV